MITRFIGSAFDLKNVNTIALVFMDNNKTLVDDLIPEYILNSNYFDLCIRVDKNENGEFIHTIVDHFKFNNVVMYSDLGIPLGFTNLTQIIDTSELKMETVKIEFEFTIVNNTNIINTFFIDYSNHLNSTKFTHKKLFNTSEVSKQAVSRDSLTEITKTKSPFPYTNNINEIINNKELVYRYSGSFSKGFDRITHKEWEIPSYELSKIHELLVIDSKLYLIILDGTSIRIYEDYNSIPISIEFGELILEVGSNIIITQDDSGRNIYSTLEAIKGRKTKVLSTSNSFGIITNGVTREKLFYKYSEDYGIIPISKKLSELFVRLNFDQRYNIPLVVSDGLWIEYDYDEGVTKVYSMFNKSPQIIQGSIREIKLLSDSLFIYKKNNDNGDFSYIYEIKQGRNSIEYVGFSYLFGNGNRYSRLDMLSKGDYKRSDVRNINLLNIHEPGGLWKYEDLGTTLKIRRL